ncbi:hypothetical protein GCM10027277_59380 [Pseudoduganella ginsengisoli]
MVKGSVPSKFEKRNRILVPPALVRTTWRIVCGLSGAPAPSGAAIQPATQAVAGSGGVSCA